MDTGQPTGAKPTAGSESAAWGLGSQVIGIWSDIAAQDNARAMQEDLMKFNNSMRAINQSVKQFTADSNRVSLTNQHMQDEMQIDVDRMKSEAQVEVYAGAEGASANARRAALFDINRNAVVARNNQNNSFEQALKQVQLQEFGSNSEMVQSYQNPNAPTSPSALQGAFASILSGGKTGIDQGALKKGNWGDRAFSGVKDFFSGGSGVTINGEFH